MGYKKTNIGRIIFGASSYAMFLRFIDEGKEQDFGIKPLERAADVLGYETRVVFVNPDNEDPIIDEIRERNQKYALELEEYLIEHFNNNSEEKRTRKSTLDNAIDSILNL